MSWFLIFIVHVLTARFEKPDLEHAEPTERTDTPVQQTMSFKYQDGPSSAELSVESQQLPASAPPTAASPEYESNGQHTSEQRVDFSSKDDAFNPDSYAAQMTGLFVLEFGKSWIGPGSWSKCCH